MLFIYIRSWETAVSIAFMHAMFNALPVIPGVILSNRLSKPLKEGELQQ